MLASVIIVASIGLVVSSVIAAPAAVVARSAPYTLADSFPNPNASEIQKIESVAGGSLPNGLLPAVLSEASATNLRLIAFNEIFEVAYFTDLLLNITSNQTGYTDFGVFSRTFIIDSITAVINQEQLHALSANGALAAFNAGPIIPCCYKFPVSNYKDAIALAATFTDVVLGTLQAAQYAFATNNDSGLVPFIGSVIGQEGEQNGFYRIIQQKRPSSSPFLTASAAPFAFSALQTFVVPGSCPNIATIDIPILKPLTIVAKMTSEPVNQTLEFMVPGTPSLDGMHVIYISGQNAPVVEPIRYVWVYDNTTIFYAHLPFQGVPMFSVGLTIAAVTTGRGPFADAAAVADAAVYGPELIEFD